MNQKPLTNPERLPLRSIGVAQGGPNNLGPTMLIAVGMVGAPVGIGIPLLLLGLALLRTSHGTSAFPLLATTLSTLQQQLQSWSPR